MKCIMFLNIFSGIPFRILIMQKGLLFRGPKQVVCNSKELRSRTNEIYGMKATCREHLRQISFD